MPEEISLLEQLELIQSGTVLHAPSSWDDPSRWTSPESLFRPEAIVVRSDHEDRSTTDHIYVVQADSCFVGFDAWLATQPFGLPYAFDAQPEIELPDLDSREIAQAIGGFVTARGLHLANDPAWQIDAWDLVVDGAPAVDALDLDWERETPLSWFSHVVLAANRCVRGCSHKDHGNRPCRKCRADGRSCP
jgi:hypothetical protein